MWFGRRPFWGGGQGPNRGGEATVWKYGATRAATPPKKKLKENKGPQRSERAGGDKVDSSVLSNKNNSSGMDSRGSCPRGEGTEPRPGGEKVLKQPPSRICTVGGKG